MVGGKGFSKAQACLAGQRIQGEGEVCTSNVRVQLFLVFFGGFPEGS
jgi:hypothetical protein